MSMESQRAFVLVTADELRQFIKQSRIGTFEFGGGTYSTETVCECLVCSVALRQIQIQKSVPIGYTRPDGKSIRRGVARIETGAFKDCFVCAPCKKVLGLNIIELAAYPEDMSEEAMTHRLEEMRTKLLQTTLLRITGGDPDREYLVLRALATNLLGGFSQASGLPEYAYDYARLQRITGMAKQTEASDAPEESD